ncbi:hypothetical protein A3K86_15490 [Photobacterium jeanii]|uniref:Lipid/polyisoprenoid-binding YceI-like domain-containing protein n=1 Tax=Photobacterium jeanii TaxID=858640 RepID=A0A178K7F7_9GAMM|nr:YceI family protein [Photobacterium jeanii]OAN13067.1 hypothetical protein A3K86_15490 [Photobacterium jeanii]PST89216.1 YceI family protein [Photobacterium jeanii]
MRNLKTLLVAMAFVQAPFASADWMLDNDQSLINFLSIKNASVIETHHFKQLEGTLSDKGKAHVVISLASVATNIDIRDERMRSMLFNTDLFPSALLNADLDLEALETLEIGQTKAVPVQFTLELHGQEQQLETQLQVTKLEGGDILASTLQPVVIDAAKFKLNEGVEALRKVAKLDTIVQSVPVNVQLYFNNSDVAIANEK